MGGKWTDNSKLDEKDGLLTSFITQCSTYVYSSHVFLFLYMYYCDGLLLLSV